MLESIQVSAVMPTVRERVYQAWLSSREHTAFTGSKASIDPKAGGEFTAGDGYIRGKTLELEPHQRIIQSWRSSDFSPGDADSLLEVVFEEVGGGTRLTLIHSNIPEGQGQMYEQGWKEYYLEPMKRYFKKRGSLPSKSR